MTHPQQIGSEQWQAWARRLSAIQDEMEKALGEPEPGLYDDKATTLVRYAWEATDEERVRAVKREGGRRY